MYRSIAQYISSCLSCKQFKTNRTKSAGQLQLIEPPAGVWELIGLDFVDPVPVSSNDNKYILVCTDYLSKYAIAEVTRDCWAQTAAKFLVNKIILQYGVDHISSTTYHPQTNGLTGRFHSILVDTISA